MIVIEIRGKSKSGKSAVARLITAQLAAHGVTVVNSDADAPKFSSALASEIVTQHVMHAIVKTVELSKFSKEE